MRFAFGPTTGGAYSAPSDPYLDFMVGVGKGGEGRRGIREERKEGKGERKEEGGNHPQ